MGKDLSSSIEHNFVERKATELSSTGFKEIARLKWSLVLFQVKLELTFLAHPLLMTTSLFVLSAGSVLDESQHLVGLTNAAVSILLTMAIFYFYSKSIVL